MLNNLRMYGIISHSKKQHQILLKQNKQLTQLYNWTVFPHIKVLMSHQQQMLLVNYRYTLYNLIFYLT